VRDGQTSPHKPRLVVPRSTCPSLSPSPPAHSFIIGPAVINTHTPTTEAKETRGPGLHRTAASVTVTSVDCIYAVALDGQVARRLAQISGARPIVSDAVRPSRVCVLSFYVRLVQLPEALVRIT